MSTVKFSPKVTSVQFAGGNVKMTLVASAEDVERLTKADLSELQGQYITASLMPESIEVITQLDEDGHPTIAYTQDNGVWTAHKQEQTNLLDKEKLTDKSEFIAIKEIDEFIKTASYLESDFEINPKQLIDDLNSGIKVEDIADENGYGVDTVKEEISAVRKYYAPFALAAKKAAEK